MNEKGWCSTLGGSFAVIRTVRPVPGRKLYERLSSLSHPPGALSFRFLPRLLARSYISHCGFEIIFMSRRQRLPRSTVCIHISAWGSAVSYESASSIQLWIMQSRESCWLRELFPWIITNRDSPRTFVRHGVIFFGLLCCYPRCDSLYLFKSNRM